MNNYQQLFDLLQSRGLTLLQSEMDEVVEACLPLLPQIECSDALATLLENLRHYQKRFFSAKPGTLERQTALIESKRLEKELDAFLQHRKAEKADTQLKLL